MLYHIISSCVLHSSDVLLKPLLAAAHTGCWHSDICTYKSYISRCDVKSSDVCVSIVQIHIKELISWETDFPSVCWNKVFEMVCLKKVPLTQSVPALMQLWLPKCSQILKRKGFSDNRAGRSIARVTKTHQVKTTRPMYRFMGKVLAENKD